MNFTPPGDKRPHGERARLYIRWMPHLGAEPVALYELLRVLPGVGVDSAGVEELAELLRSTPASVERSMQALVDAGFATWREGWLEVAEHPPNARGSGKKPQRNVEKTAEERSAYNVEVVRAAPEGVTPDDYFRFMGSLPAPHILEFLNGYCERDGLSPEVVREALKIASERDARRVGYVRSILERWVERGVKTVEDVERFEKDRKLRLVEQGGGSSRSGKGVRGGADQRSGARRREDYGWFFGE